MKETELKGYYFAVVEKITNIRTIEAEGGLVRQGDKEVALVEFVDEEEGHRYFERIQKEINPETESFRVLADQETAFHIQKIVDELDYHKKRLKHIPIPTPPVEPGKK